MNKFKQVRKGMLFLWTTILVTSCVHDDDYAVPPIQVSCVEDRADYTSIADLVAQNPDGEPMEITEDLILEGYVVSSDANGNFFKSLVIQNSPTDPTHGMSIEFDLEDTHRKFPVGNKVMVNAKGLYFGRDRATYKIGTTYTDDFGDLRLGRMTEIDALDKVKLVCNSEVEITPKTYSSIQDFKENAVVNTLVKLENVQFKDVKEGDTYYDANDKNNTFGGATNRVLEDQDGNQIVLRTSKYTNFADAVMPMGSGSVVAVLSAYSKNNNPTPSTYQLFLRDISEVDMDNARFNDDDNGDGNDGGDDDDQGAGIIGGDNASYNGCQVIDFESYKEDDKTFPEYINDAKVGDRYWAVKEYNSNKYIQLTAYNADAAIESYFIIPVDFDISDSFSFKSKDGYNKGEVLSVYYVKSYDLATKKLDMDNLVDITSAFDISTGNDSGYGDSFTPSGDYDLSNISGKGAIVFAYKGSGSGITTTMQLDDIIIVDNENANCN